MRITVVTPTRGIRDTLNNVIEQVAKLLLPGDEHLLIYDAPDNAPQLDYRSSLFTKLHRVHVPGSVYGNAQRDFAATVAQGDCLVYMDDDDLPGAAAFAALHAAEPDRNVTHFFRMQTRGGFFNSNTPGVGQMGGPQCVPPVRPDLPKWMSHNIYEADGYFLVKCHKSYRPVYHQEIICYVRGQEWNADCK